MIIVLDSGCRETILFCILFLPSHSNDDASQDNTGSHFCRGGFALYQVHLCALDTYYQLEAYSNLVASLPASLKQVWPLEAQGSEVTS